MVSNQPRYAELFEEFFNPTRIIINHQKFEDANKLFEWCVSILYPSIEKEVSYDAVIKKFSSLPSFLILESGLLFQHAKFEGISDFHSVLVVLSRYSLDLKTKKEVRGVFLLFSPFSKDKFEKHLQILSLVSGLFKDPDILKKISELSSSDDIYHFLKHLI